MDPVNTVRVDSLYRHRFDDRDRAAKDAVWKVLCEAFFSKYVRASDTVLDVGAGYCEFINHVSAARRIAVDANPELARFARLGVEARCTSAERLDFLSDASVDVAFTSNFLEHLPDKGALLALVREIARVLKPGGHLLIMGPNVKYVPGSYWDYFDHHIALTEKSVGELLHLCGFSVTETVPRFMPYTVKSRLPKWPWLVRLYLRVGKPAFMLFGKQFFVVGQKT